MNSKRAKPTPEFGIKEFSKLHSGLPTFNMTFTGSCKLSDIFILSMRKGNMESYTNPVSPSAQEMVTSSLSFNLSVAFPAPTTAFNPNSRATMAA